MSIVFVPTDTFYMWRSLIPPCLPNIKGELYRRNPFDQYVSPMLPLTKI